MKMIAAILISYLLGSINPAYIIGRIKGFDIRTKGSLNAGASNAKVTMGLAYFFIVLFLDLTKIFASYFIAFYCLKIGRQDAIAASAFAVIGHIFPFYLNFKGGKGFAGYIALTLLIDWRFALVVVAVGLIVSFLANWIVCATIIVTLSTPIYYLISHPNDILTFIVLALVSTIILFKHKENFKRLAKKKEIGINGCYVGTKIKSESK